MALALGVEPGNILYIGDEPLTVEEFEGQSRAVVSFRGQRFEISDLKATKLMKNVYVSCGLAKHSREGDGLLPQLPRLLIDAPRSLTILREELYRNGKPRQQPVVPATP